MKKIMSILMITLSLICCSNAYCENYENNPEVCTYVINNVNNEAEKEMAYYHRAKYYYDNGNYQQAISDFTESIKRATDPEGKAESIFYRAQSYYAIQNYNDAFSDYTQVLQLANNSTSQYLKELSYDVYMFRSRTAALIGNEKIALADANKLIQTGVVDKDPTAYGSTYFTRGAIYYSQENYPNAISDITHYLNFPQKLDNIGSITETGQAYYIRGSAKLEVSKNHNDVLSAFKDLEKSIQIYAKGNSAECVREKERIIKFLKLAKQEYYK